ncbi:MAG: response regulator [Bacteroidota bacterium]
MSEHAPILIVDDNPSNIQILGNTLRMNDLSFEFALSGEAALGWLQKQRFDVVLLDLMMPNMDGFETLSEIRSNPDWQDISVIFLTAKTDFNALIKGFDGGAQDYITKPFNSKELISRVRAHMGLSAHQNLLKTFNTRLEHQVEARTQELEQAMKNAKALNDSLANLISNIPGAVFRGTLGDGLVMHYLSTQFEQLSGYSTDEVLGAAPAFGELIDEDLSKMRDAIEDQLSRNLSRFNVRVRICRRDGEVIWISMRGSCQASGGAASHYDLEGVMYDITPEIAMEERLMAASIQAADRERNFFARELHDGVQQSLAMVALSLQGLEVEGLSDRNQEKFHEAIDMLNKSIKEVRDISHRLAPKSVSDLGLVSALRELVDRQNMANGTHFELQENVGDRRFLPAVELNLYRIVQESFTNIRKYASASQVHLQVFVRDQLLTLMVEDDGIGFDKSEVMERYRGFGLVGMERRATSLDGVFELNTMPTKGTQILVEVPIEPHIADA